MRHLIATVFVACVFSSTTVAQDKFVIPPRFQELDKNGRLKLTRILGTPEMQPAVGATTAFTANGKRAVYVEDLTTGAADKPAFRARVHVWNAESKAWPREFEIAGKSVTCLTMSADGKRALLAGETRPEKDKDTNPYFGLWDLETGKEIRSFITTERHILAMALSPDETTVLTGTSENLKAWDLKNGKTTIEFAPNQKFGVTSLAYLPGGKQFLAGYHGGETRLFDVGKKDPVRTFKTKGSGDFVWHLVISADGKRFAAGQFQTSVTLWDIGGKEINSLRLFESEKDKFPDGVVTSVALAADGKTVVFTLSKTAPEADDFACAKLIAWDGDANKNLWSRVVSHRGRPPIQVVGGNVLVGGGPNLLESYALKDGTPQFSVGAHKSPVATIGVLADGSILSGGLEGMLMTWTKGELASKERSHAGPITAMALSRDRKEWLTAGADLSIRIWPPQASRKLEFKKAHAGPITGLALGGGNLAYSASGDRTVKSWNLEIGGEVASFAGHSEGVNAVAISPDDRWLASGSDDTTIKIWPIKDGKLDPDREPITLEKHKKAVTCLTFTPDGKRLISGSQDQTLMVWNWQKGSMDFMIPGHKNWITSILLLDAKTLLTASDDLNVCAWDLETGMEIGRVDFGVVGDCPRCLAQVGPDRFLVGSSSWLIYEFQLLPAGKTKGGKGSSNK